MMFGEPSLAALTAAAEMRVGRFDPYSYLDRVAGKSDGEPIMLSDEFRATDIGLMLKTALRAVELLSVRVAELERTAGAVNLPDFRSKDTA